MTRDENIMPILSTSEKEYLRAVIKPFRKKFPITVGKYSWAWGNEKEYITINIWDTGRPNSYDIIGFPYFETGKMYKGMEVDKEYTLEELGL